MHNPFTLFPFASGALASYGGYGGGEYSGGGHSGGGKDCLSYKQASELVNGFTGALDNHFNRTVAEAILANDFQLISQGLNSVAEAKGAALQGPTFPSKESLIEAQAGRTFPLTVTVLEIDAVGCTNIGWRWRAVPNNGVPLRAISIFHCIRNRTTEIGWQISRVYGEFDSLTWAEDFGANCTLPPPPGGIGGS